MITFTVFEELSDKYSKQIEKISINPLIVHGEDSTQVAFSERVELAQFHGCCAAFVCV